MNSINKFQLFKILQSVVKVIRTHDCTNDKKKSLTLQNYNFCANPSKK